MSNRSVKTKHTIDTANRAITLISSLEVNGQGDCCSSFWYAGIGADIHAALEDAVDALEVMKKLYGLIVIDTSEDRTITISELKEIIEG